MKRSPKGQFLKGTHWRDRKPWWDKAWLENEYVTLRKSSADIAKANGLHENAVLHWLKKHGIPRRTLSQARVVKHWGSEGEKNPMFGKRGALNPNWRGGLTPLRLQYYAKKEWKDLVRAVWGRDKSCRLCGSKTECQIHHIDPFSLSPLLVLDIGNVILLCKPCHTKLRGKELKWKRRLLKLIQPERR